MYILIGLLVWTICSFIWFWNALGRKMQKPTLAENIVDHIFSPPIMIIGTVIGFILHTDYRRNAYWVFAQFVRACLLPIVLPVRLYEWIKR